jgi:hypothetical protein
MKDVQTRRTPIVQTPLFERQKQERERAAAAHRRLVATIKKANK